jgi:stearoyl-CoA desaturase (delta-9 desaturase)
MISSQVSVTGHGSVAASSERPDPDPSYRAGWGQILPAGLLVGVPAIGALVAVVRFWNHGVTWFDMSLAAAFYVITGLGVTVGFHRFLTHRSFHARRWLKMTLTIAGSMALEGSPISWVSQHRRHHVYSDRTGDPHSPWRYGAGARATWGGFWHAHVGWLFVGHRDEPERWSAELLADRDVRRLSALTPLWSALSLLLPFGVGYAVTGTLWGAVLALVWGGLVRVFVLHHVTWSINSLCHLFGKRPFRSNDRSANFAPLALLSFGESWHNAHHAFPSLARHGVDRGQVDVSAVAIRIFERLGWASGVTWPTPDKLARRRIDA